MCMVQQGKAMTELSKGYRCAACGGSFNASWSDEEANAEAEKFWGVTKAKEDARMVVVCDDCFQRMHPADHPELAKRARDRLTQ